MDNDNTTEVITSSPCPNCGCQQWEVMGDYEDTIADEMVTVIDVCCVNCSYERELIED